MNEEKHIVDLAFQVQKRQRPDRHPYQIGTLSGLLASAISQIIIGVPPSSILYDEVTWSALISVNGCFIVGATLGLIGAITHRNKDPRISLRLGIAGQISVFVASVYYVITIMTVINAPYWLSILSAGTGFGVCYASSHRVIQQRRALKDIRKVISILHPEVKQRGMM